MSIENYFVRAVSSTHNIFWKSFGERENNRTVVVRRGDEQLVRAFMCPAQRPERGEYRYTRVRKFDDKTFTPFKGIRFLVTLGICEYLLFVYSRYRRDRFDGSCDCMSCPPGKILARRLNFRVNRKKK